MEKLQNKHEDIAPSEDDKRTKINKALKELEESIEITSRLCNAEAKLRKVIYDPDQMLKQMPETYPLLATLEEAIKELRGNNVDDGNNLQLKDAKLLDYTQEDGVAASLRKKRQALHDQRRVPPVESADAATDTSDDLLTYKVDNSKLGSDDKQAAELKRLKMALEKVSQQKNELEHQLSAALQQGREDTIMKKNEDIEDLSLCNAEAKLQGSDNDKGEDINTLQENDEEYKNNLHVNTNNYVGYLERENVDLKTKYEHLKKKTLLREKELLSRIQEYAGAHKQACSSSEVSNGQKGENNKSIEPTLYATEEPVPPKIDQSLKKFTIKNKESSEIKSTHKTKIVDQMIMEQAERRCMEVSHGPEVNAPAPENIKQITRKKRQQLHDLRRDIENGLGIPKFVISRHYHYHHYHYHHFL